ncbi:Zinc finger protein 91 [Holothuria leucospilota]|uniref:Zinc finger protein 91 n=1 Tax=Holothuria leucospilota TaxID=206669 RepID=A0A9Q1GZT7_HOLLE|nr:Zinc finger protein 91 [Holothuria leucospilota]
MFWGLTLKPGRRHTEVFREEICLSMATLESRKDYGEKPDNYSHVVVKTQNSDFLLCTLVHGLQFQQNLNIKLMPKEKITFRVQGTSKVYLTGFTPACPVGDEDEEEAIEGQGEEEEEEGAKADEELVEEEDEDEGWRVDDCQDAENNEMAEDDVIESLSGEDFNKVDSGLRPSAVLSSKDDNFLSVAELNNLPVKEESSTDPKQKTTRRDSENVTREGNNNEPAEANHIEEGGSISQEESGDEWILDDAEGGDQDDEEFTEVSDRGNAEDADVAVDFQCDLCDMTFNTEEKKCQHESTHHISEGTSYHNPHVSSSASKQQIRFPTAQKKYKKYKCRYCNKLLAGSTSLRRHEALHVGNRKFYQCQFCPKTFSLNANKLRHEQLHTSSNVYKCLICDKGFSTIPNRDKHVLSHFKKDAQRCDLCRQVTCKGECMQTEEILNAQQEEVQQAPSEMKQFRCQFCPKVFQLKASRNRHQKTHSSGTSSPASQTSKNAEKTSGKLECKYCYQLFTSKDVLESHERAHTNEERPFSCKCCQKTFLSHFGRRKHELRHPEMRQFVCKFCNKRFSQPNLWKIHETTHTEERPYKCHYCDRTFANNGCRKNHEVVHKKGSNKTPQGTAERKTENSPSNQVKSSPSMAGSRLNCRYCGKLFSSTGNKSRHEKLHEGFKLKKASFKCRQCSKSFNNSTDLEEHGCNADTIQKYECNSCHTSFADQSALNRHKATHTTCSGQTFRKTCRYCGKKFSANSARIRHERIHTGEKPFVCNHCDFKTGDPSSYSKHMKRHVSHPFKCPYCPFRFTSLNSLKLHETSHQGSKDVFTCNECDRKFPSKKLLQSHEQSHIDFRPFRCTDCSKTFITADTLKRHEQVHEKDQPFKCKQCGRHFKTSSGLQKHGQLCVDGKPHKCRYCSKSFSSVNGCHLHEESHIVDRPFKCNHCDRGFLSNHSREIHEKTHTL